MEREYRCDTHALLAGLMHDAHEAFSGDMHTPGKSEIGAAWHRWEHRWAQLVRSHFALHTASVAHRDVIRLADLRALATERRDLLPETPTDWRQLEGIQPVDWVRLDEPARVSASWEDWRDRFLDRLCELEFARAEGLESSSVR